MLLTRSRQVAPASANYPDIISPLPVISHGRIYINTGVLRIFDQQTGASVGKYQLSNSRLLFKEDPVVINSSVYIAGDANTSGTQMAVYSLQEKDGLVLWQKPIDDVSVLGTADSLLYTSAYKATNGTELWHTSLTDNSVGDNTITPVVANDSVYTIASNHLSDTVYALSAVNGHILWHRSLQSPGFYGKQPLAVAGNTVLLTDVYHSPYSPTPNPMSQQGASLTALRTNDGGMLWKNWFGGFSDPSLSIDHDVVYAVSLSSDTATNILHAWQIKTGRQLWSVPVS